MKKKKCSKSCLHFYSLVVRDNNFFRVEKNKAKKNNNMIIIYVHMSLLKYYLGVFQNFCSVSENDDEDSTKEERKNVIFIILLFIICFFPSPI